MWSNTIPGCAAVAGRVVEIAAELPSFLTRRLVIVPKRTLLASDRATLASHLRMRC
jgi:hypothetical protein